MLPAPPSETLASLRAIAVEVLSCLPPAQVDSLPECLQGISLTPDALSADDLAFFLFWAQSTEGHRRIEEQGYDPDLFPTPFPFVIIADRSELFLYAQPQEQGANADIRDFLKRQQLLAPNIFRLVDPAGSLPFLRQLVTRNNAYVPAATISYLRGLSTATPVAQQSWDVQISSDGDLLIMGVEATSSILTALRKVTSPTWSDKHKHWRIPRKDIPTSVKALQAQKVIVPDPVKNLARAIDSPLLAMGDLSDLKDIPVTRLRGLGDRRAEKFGKVGIETIYDLLLYVPRRYLDRSKLTSISGVLVGQEVALLGHITSIQPNASRRIVKFTISDGSGSITATFFNALWQAKRFKTGDQVIVLGKVEEWRGRTRIERQMTNPMMESFTDDTHLVVPVYSQSAKNGLSTWEIRKATDEAINRIGIVNDPLPEHIKERLNLPDRAQSLTDVHFPQSLEGAELARDRLAFDEFLRLQLALLRARKTMETETAVPQRPTGILTTRLVDSLPFPLTGAQQRAWNDVLSNIAAPVPMHRLIQGDVGSGKTLIAILALLAGNEGGNQGALMAPTEILATQLYLELSGRLEDAGLSEDVKVALLTSKTRARERRQILEEVKNGDINILVGTHSLIGADVLFSSLGIVVIDEQHRFGVEQRAALRAKVADGGAPDMLVMTATPIPRTAAITAFGDLDVSVIDELPPGRTPIETTWVRSSVNLDSPLASPWDDVLEQISQGRQAFVVCPLVEGSEKMQATSATETFEGLATGALSGLRLILVHGQQKAEERAQAMAAFAAGEADVLVSTTVIEVGVNVPNATRMVILNADRFGIAQLHQLRGRVGRGKHASRCYLVAEPTSSEGHERLQALCDSTDGFYLSEVDLSLRGAGNILGSEQSGGVSDFRVADILRDRELLETAREVALEIIEVDSTLSAYPLIRREVFNAVGEEQAAWLFKS